MNNRTGVVTNAASERPAPKPSTNSRTVRASIGVPRAPQINGATGLPNLARFRPYQRPPTATAHVVAIAVSRTRRPDRRHTKVTTAGATPTPGYFAPAATPANRPATATSDADPRPIRQHTAPAVAATS